MPLFTRRQLLKAVALVPAAGAGAAVTFEFAPRVMPTTGQNPPGYASPARGFLSAPEKAFVEAAVARMIPADALGPGAKEAGVGDFIDHQLAGPYGSAETWYMQGPWADGTKEQGYQLKLSPAELYRAAIAQIDDYVGKTYGGKTFAQLDTKTQDDLLQAIDDEKVKVSGNLAKKFVDILVVNTTEGFLADPLYGGNRDFIGWKLVGFPGPRYNYVAEIDQHGKKFDMPFVSIAGAALPTKEA